MSDASIQRGSAILKRIRQSLFGLFLVLLGFAVGFRTFEGLNEPAPLEITRVPHPSYTVVSESGERRGGLFDSKGDGELIHLGRWALRGQRPKERCAKEA